MTPLSQGPVGEPLSQGPVRVLAVTLDYPPRRRIGSELATHEVLRHLAAAGHEVTVAPQHVDPSTLPWTFEGVPVRPGLDLETIDVDLVWCHAELLPKVARQPAPTVAVTHNARTPVTFGLLAGCDLIVHNAHATAAALAAVTAGIPSTVCHPVVRPGTVLVDGGDRDHVTLIGCTHDKGIHVLTRLARAFPDVPFLAVRSGYGRHAPIRRPNITLHPHTDDMREVYARTRVLLVPSRHESYGRVVVEAQLNGIPVVANDLPGLREAGGDAATYVRVNNIDGWIAAVSRLTGDPVVHRDAAMRAVEHAWTVNDPDGDLDRLTRTLLALAGSRVAA